MIDKDLLDTRRKRDEERANERASTILWIGVFLLCPPLWLCLLLLLLFFCAVVAFVRELGKAYRSVICLVRRKRPLSK